jgi:hypothetical protein
MVRPLATCAQTHWSCYHWYRGPGAVRCAMGEQEDASAKRVALPEGNPLLNAEILPLILRFADAQQFLFLASVCSYWKQGYLKHMQADVKDLPRGNTSTFCSSALLSTLASNGRTLVVWTSAVAKRSSWQAS